MEITLRYDVPVTKTYKITDKKWKEFFKAWFTDDDDRNVNQWHLVKENDIADFIRAMGDEVDYYSEIDIDNFKE